LKVEQDNNQALPNPYEMELADVARELGANIRIEYYTATVTFTLAQLEQIQKNQLPTDVLSLVMFAFLNHGTSKDDIIKFFAEAEEHGCKPKVHFVDPNGVN